MKPVVNSQASEAPEITAAISQGSFLSPTLFLFYINNLPKNILRLLVNIYVDDTTFCGCTCQNLDDWSWAADLFSDQVLTAQWWVERWFVTFILQKPNK